VKQLWSARFMRLFCTLTWLASSAMIPSAIAQETTAGSSQSSTEISVPHLIRFSGLLHASAANQTTGLTFTLYKDQTGGAPLWVETQNVLPDASGRYTVLLGTSHAEGIPAELFSDLEAHWLGVQVVGEQELVIPRVQLVSVPYALKAGDASTIGGHPLSDFVLSNGGSSGSSGSGNSGGTGSTNTVMPLGTIGSGNLNAMAKYDGSGNILGSTVVFDTGTALGVGTGNPGSFVEIDPPSTAQTIKFGVVPWGLRFGALQAGQQFIGMGVGKAAADNFYVANSNNDAPVGHAAIELNFDGSINFRQQAHQPDGTVLSMPTTMSLTPAGTIGMGTTTPESFLEVDTPTTAQTIKLGSVAWGLRFGQLQAGQQFMAMGVSKTGADNNYIAKTNNTAAVAHSILEFNFDGTIDFRQQAHQPDGTVLTLPTTLAMTPSGNLGVGTAAPGQKLSVAGVVESTTGGFKFPDGTLQTSAAGSTSGGLVSSITAGAGLASSPNPITSTGTMQVNFTTSGGDDGSAVTVARGDHLHDARYVQLAPQGFAYSNSSVSGHYAFSEVGTYASGGYLYPVSGNGTFQADGNGNISGTLVEYESGGSCQDNITGTYSVGSSGQGTLTITVSPITVGCSSYSSTFNLSVTQQGASAVFAESDLAGWVSGSVLRQ